MIQIIKNGDDNKHYSSPRVIFDNRTTCSFCKCEFQFDSEDLIKPDLFVVCPWCKTTTMPTIHEEFLN